VTDRTMKMVDGDSVGQLLDTGRSRLSQTCVMRLERLGLRIDGARAPSYPVALWAQAVTIMAEDLFPLVDATEAQRRLAHLRMAEFERRPSSKLLLFGSKLLGQRRALERFVHGLGRATSYLQLELTALDQNRYEVWINDTTGVPGFFWGMIETGARYKSQRLVTRIKNQHGSACTFEIDLAA